MPIRILLADDHAVVRDGVRALREKQADMAVVAEKPRNWRRNFCRTWW
jgi:DNA-binding NarL/FixJ family response regulator